MNTLISAILIFSLTFAPVQSRDITLQLEDALLYDLKPLAHEFVKAEQKYGVSAVLLASIAALESGWGRDCFLKNNLFGFGQLEFDTRADCIDHVARYLKEEYLTPGGAHFNGYTIEAINMSYNPDHPEWSDAVEEIMAGIEERMQASAV